MTALPGRVEVTISSPTSFRLIAASAGPGWRTRLAPTAAMLDGRATAGRSLLVAITGRASRPGKLPVDVQVASPRGPSTTYRWQLTALAGYAQPVSSLAGAARPDAAVAVEDGRSHGLWPLSPWPVSLVFAFVALLVLVVRRPRSREHLS
jgi:hypothetical protein